jgi:hypothetical protein
MKTYDKNKPLISIHIPKTGGSGFREILENWFAADLYFHYFDEKNNRMPEKHQLRPGICIHGHFNRGRNFGIKHYYPEADQFITFLRDPFEIVVSRYFFEKKRETVSRSFRGGKPLNLTSDIDQYLDEELRKKDYHPNILDYMPVEITLDNYKQVIDEYFIYIGIVEDFQCSLDKLAAKLKFPAFAVELLNKSERFVDFSLEYRERFRETHPCEYAIYNYVSENYKKW